jgi:hypothetical protein
MAAVRASTANSVSAVWQHLVRPTQPLPPSSTYSAYPSDSYCNSIVQCLYYSVPFRDQVINFPARSPPEALERPSSASLPKIVKSHLENAHEASDHSRRYQRPPGHQA